MKEIELKIKFLKVTEPYEVVGVDMDCFCPYNTTIYPSEFDDIDEWIENDYVMGLQGCGSDFVNQELKRLEKELSDRLDNMLVS